MGLGHTKPDQGVIDALTLDAAWERAKQCEAETRQAKAIASQTHKNLASAIEANRKLVNGIKAAIRAHPEPETGKLRDALWVLIEDWR